MEEDTFKQSLTLFALRFKTRTNVNSAIVDVKTKIVSETVLAKDKILEEDVENIQSMWHSERVVKNQIGSSTQHFVCMMPVPCQTGSGLCVQGADWTSDHCHCHGAGRLHPHSAGLLDVFPFFYCGQSGNTVNV